eukprot:TRINITY_DN16657_c0_g1_i1.p1 TRINITY_DN16657_c0_g1~~TRINITY_DN16657_c0_g1_i1.p1  ORF type:complete len:982 (+),score=329.76 TRINITY_DN16657_c0_g1_i1:182-3127(+)
MADAKEQEAVAVDVAALEEKESGGNKEFGGPKDEEKPFEFSEGITTDQAKELLHIHGKNELEEKITPSWLVYLKQLKGPMPIMIWIAIVVEAAIQNWLDMGILLGIQFINATIGWYETTKAANAVAALKASLKPFATVKRDGKWQQIDARLVVPGDLVGLNAGAAVPADCRVNDGRIEVDQSALTGESLPVTMRRGDAPKMGSTITRGEVEGTVEFTGKNTFFGKTATMLQTVDELGNLQKILLKIMFVLVVISLTLCFIALMYLIFDKDTSFKKALSFVVVLLVASIPIAIEIVCTCTLALGSRQLAAMHAIVTRLVSIEEMAGMNMLCSDKTGTLTLNKMVIQDECPIFTPNVTRDDVILAAALAAKWKEPAKDALDTMVLGTAPLAKCDEYQQVDYMPFDPSVKRTEGTLVGPDGKKFKTTKGAPQIIMGLCHNKAEIAKEVESTVHQFGLRGIRCLAVARTVEGTDNQWELMGIMTFLDPPRPDTKRTIERAMEYGVGVKMITGDQVVIACETSRTLGLGTNIKGAQGLPDMPKDGKVPKDLGKKYGKMIAAADGFAQVYPEHKYLIVETLRQEGYTVGMTGDGVNDAPALKRADVGIAVSGATDAARAAADIVLTSPGLSVVVEAIIIARCIFQRVLSFINYRVAATLQLLCFFFIAVFAFPPNSYESGTEVRPKFFQLPVLMLMLITLLNDGTLITIGYDYVIPSNRPEKWNLKVLFLTSSILAAVACGSSLLLLWCALDSYNQSGVFHAFGLPHIEYGQITTLIYLKVSLSDFLTLFSARTQSWFWTQRPGKLLMFGATFALTISTILACVWPSGKLDDLEVKGLARGNYGLWAIWVWIYCIVWWLIQDTAKVVAYRLIYKYNIFNAQAGRKVLTRDMSHYAEGHEMEEKHSDDVVQLSYSVKTGKAVAADLKKHIAENGGTGTPGASMHGHMGNELDAKMTEDEHGEIYMTVSYSKQSGKDVAKQLKEQLRKK